LAKDENELVALLEAKAIDYAFLYASTAEDHRLKVTRLSDATNLSRLALRASYAKASVEVHLKTGEPATRLVGRPITYGLAVLSSAPSPARPGRLSSSSPGEEGSEPAHPRLSSARGSGAMITPAKLLGVAVLAAVHLALAFVPGQPISSQMNLVLFAANLYTLYCASVVLDGQSGWE
jgi:hypothetical protein